MTQDEFDRKMEFLLQSAAKSAADHEINMQWHAEFQKELRDLREACNSAHESINHMAETIARTFEAMDRRDARRDRRLDRLERIVFGHVRDPHAHGPATA